MPRAESTAARARRALASLRAARDPAILAGYARYGITVAKGFGLPMKEIQRLGKEFGPDHALAEALWKSGWYEARLLAAYVEEPDRVTPAQMERWVKGFDNWGITDTICFACWDRSPDAWGKIPAWVKRKEEWVKRSGFVLLASLALHDKTSPDARFVRLLPLIERFGDDERNFVKKGVSWALRSVGRRRPKLRKAAIAMAARMAKSEGAGARWVGRDALRDLNR